MTTTMCSISGIRSVPSALVGSGRCPATRRTVVVVVGADVRLGPAADCDDPPHPPSATAPAVVAAVATVAPDRNPRRDIPRVSFIAPP